MCQKIVRREIKITGAVRESATDMARQDSVPKNSTSKARRTATNCAMRHVVLPLQQPLVRRQCCNTLASGVSFTWKNASHRSFTSRSSTRRSMRMVVLWSRRASEVSGGRRKQSVSVSLYRDTRVARGGTRGLPRELQTGRLWIDVSNFSLLTGAQRPCHVAPGAGSFALSG